MEDFSIKSPEGNPLFPMKSHSFFLQNGNLWDFTDQQPTDYKNGRWSTLQATFMAVWIHELLEAISWAE